MIPVLVTGMNSVTAISIVKGLRQQAELLLHIVGTDTNLKNEIAGSSFCDQFYTVPKAVEDNYISQLVDICVAENVKIIFPVVDIELEIIATNIEVFRNQGIQVWLSNLETIQTCNNKYQTYKFFLDHKFATPQTWLPEEITGREADFPYPLIVKPIDGRSSIDVFCVEDVAALQQALKKVNQPIIQEYLEGKEFTIDVVADEDSRILAVVPRERIEIKAGISYKGRTVKDQQLIEKATDIAQKLQIKGACNIQCRVKDNLVKFFEVNPRFSGTLPLTIAAGVNSPLLLVKLALGQNLEKEYFDFKEGLYMARYWQEVFYE
ncbi:MAG: ATP-grasp domain-containing protein [Crinalium sp.]